MKFIFWAMASHGTGISGGDRIYIEFARRWCKTYPIIIVTWEEGIAMMARNNLQSGPNLTFLSLPIPQTPFLLQYILRIFIGVYRSFTLNIDDLSQTYLYSASEFWMDSLPCFVLKLRYPSLIWVATWFQTAPSPLIGFAQGRHRFNALLLWLSQLPVRPLIAKFADHILINNNLEKKVFPKNHTIIVLGAVDTLQVDAWRKKHRQIRLKYNAVFQGRFHPQKGVVELIDIWKLVVTQMPLARLAMIGDGPLMPQVKEQITKLGLKKNVDLLGYLFDGDRKYKVFASSQIVVHPAFFDSGGMASAEAMAFGIPAVGFNLPAYDSYYPRGMVKVPVGDLNAFAAAIVDLLDHPQRRNILGKRAGKFIYQSYSWDYRAQEILQQIVEKINQESDRGTLR